MNNRFAVFILSHGRAKTLTSYDVLRKSGYTGDVFIIVDDLDEQKDDYISIYGDKVIIFDKNKFYKLTDTMEPSGELRSITFARNASNVIAKQLGLTYHAQFDDDVTGLYHKYIGKDGKLKTRRITDFDSVVCAILDFLDDTGAVSCGLVDTGSLFGGASGPFRNGLAYNFNQTVICRTGALDFVGLGNQDVNALMLNSPRGKLLFELYCIAHSVSKPGNAGGMTEMYKVRGLYHKIFLFVMCAPSMCYMTEENKLVIQRKNVVPKILSSRWKK